MPPTLERPSALILRTSAGEHALPAKPDFIFFPKPPERGHGTAVRIFLAFAGLPGHIVTRLASTDMRAAGHFCNLVNARLGYAADTWRQIARITAMPKPDLALAAKAARRRTAAAGTETLDYAFFDAVQGPGKPIRVVLAFPDTRGIVRTSLAAPRRAHAEALCTVLNARLGHDDATRGDILRRATLAERGKIPLQ